MAGHSLRIERFPIVGDSLPAEVRDNLSLKSPWRNTVSTGTHSVSRPSTKVNEIASRQLKRLYFAEGFIDRLVMYLDETLIIQGLPNPFRASSCPGTGQLPPTQQWVRALAEISKKEHELLFYQPAPLTTNASAQDEARYQIFDLLNLLIKVKALNTVSQTPNISTSTGSIKQFFCDSKGHAIPPNNTGTSIFTPCWAHSASAHLRPIYGAGMNSGPNPGAADFSIILNPDLADQLCCAEIKSHWSYSTRNLMKIYHGTHGILDQRSMFTATPNTRMPANALLQQLIVQLFAQGSDIGFCTNLDAAFFYLIYEGENAESMIEKSLEQKNSLQGKKSVTMGLKGFLPHDGSNPLDADDDEMGGMDIPDYDYDVGAVDTTDVKSNVPGHSRTTQSGSKVKKRVQLAVQPTETSSSDTKPGLILSALMKFEDPKLLKCLQAFTYLALDRKKWQENGTTLVDVLAPLDEISLITRS
ncbi:hypothetical protein F5890DRAFT_1560003 [Lentinula detonsa]|uniref:Uncharacterized protein n=1 Tax=Lentinula detonsa TaxID=2804962 RepID=A0AA38ULC0_9AGAR|nr:hypothetical protein F5890DRAFT_1560003 [Lentinula detonsa]